MSQQNEKEILFEDISSTSKRPPIKLTLPPNLTNGFVKHLDSIVKAIAFIVAIATVILFVMVAVVLIILDSVFTVIAIGVLIVGIIFALILLYIIYGIGHLLTQNNEILKRLN